MPVSADPVAGDLILASWGVNVRDDIMDIATGHNHQGAADTGRLLHSNALNSVLTTQGDLPYRNATTLARLATGAVNDVLRANGAAANPSWGPSSKIIPFLSQGNYHTAFIVGAITTGTALAADQLFACPFYVPRTYTFNQIGIRIATSAPGTSVRLGIYDDDDVSPGRPKNLIVDAGVVSGAAVTYVERPINEQLTEGLYWCAMLSDGAPAPYSAATNNWLSPAGISAGEYRYYGAWQVGQAYGALPDPLTLGGTYIYNMWVIYVRRAP